MLLPFTEGLIKTTRCDIECAMMADRHYSRQTPGSSNYAPPGRLLSLRNWQGSILFVWLWQMIEYRDDKQEGYNCTLFRNESDRLSSEIILEAEGMAQDYWGKNRMFTYVDANKILSSNPGFCFLKAGWKRIGKSKSGKILLEKLV